MVRGVPKPDADMFAKLGIKANMQALFIEQVESVQVVFPENWLPLTVFLAVQTQWRVVSGAAGAAYTGLDYVALKAAMDLMLVNETERPDVFEDVRIMEVEWLNTHAELSKKDT